MGSQRFLFDLTRGRIAQASGVPFTGESIESVIELAGVGLPTSNASSKSVYYLLSDPKITQQVCLDLYMVNTLPYSDVGNNPGYLEITK